MLEKRIRFAVMNQENVIRIIHGISIPNLGKTIADSGWLNQVRIEEPNIYIDLVIPIDYANVKSDLTFEIISSIQQEYPEAEVHPHFITGMGAPKPQKSASGPMSKVKNIIAVGSGKGGVGKSTVALNLALGLQSLGARVGILDADLYGPSLPTMLGIQGQKPKVQVVDGKNMIVPIQRYGLYAMSLGLIVDPDQAVVLRGPRLAGIIKQFFNECSWPELDYLVVDLPPGTGDVQLSLVQTVPVTGAIIVSTPQEVAYADAIKALNMFRLESINVPVLGIVENMAWFTPEDLPNRQYFLFGKGGGKRLAKEGNTVLLGSIPLVQGVREGSDEGYPIMAQQEHIAQKYFKELAKNAARQIAIRNESLGPTQVVNIQ